LITWKKEAITAGFQAIVWFDSKEMWFRW